MCWPLILIGRKKRTIRRIVRQLPAETALLAEDETDLLLFPPLRAGWAKAGEEAKVWLSGWNARRVLFGAIDLRTVERILRRRKHGRSPDFQALLRALRHRYEDRPIAMLLDGDPSHTAQASIALAARLDIQLLWLPKRAPELNPMDALWRHTKDPIVANRQYDDIDKEVRRFVMAIHKLSANAALRMSGVKSSRFWLRTAM